jgi:hypothetical protein
LKCSAIVKTYYFSKNSIFLKCCNSFISYSSLIALKTHFPACHSFMFLEGISTIIFTNSLSHFISSCHCFCNCHYFLPSYLKSSLPLFLAKPIQPCHSRMCALCIPTCRDFYRGVPSGSSINIATASATATAPLTSTISFSHILKAPYSHF